MLTFKAIHKLAPTYISEVVSLKDTRVRYYLRSNNGQLFNIPPCKSLSTLGDRSFYMSAPKLWNDLPLFIRNIPSVNAFKKACFKVKFKIKTKTEYENNICINSAAYIPTSGISPCAYKPVLEILAKFSHPRDY